tara:strand:- start:2693 stop:4207 length:1515 start_codon:yes stop_codon:yes gene_type:complete
MKIIFLLFSSFFLLSACDKYSDSKLAEGYSSLSAPKLINAENKPGGDTTVSIKPFVSFQLPAANLDNNLRPTFHAGKALANQPWVKAPTITTARDGLGPIYNARTCLSCHIKGGKGFIPADNKTPLTSTLVRLSLLPSFSTLTKEEQATAIKKSGNIDHPVYGDQIQSQSISLAHQLRHSQKPGRIKHDVAPEAYIHINWIEKTFIYPDQHQVTLRAPELNFQYLGYGSLDKGTVFSLRVAPMIHGMGLISLISEHDILALSDEQDENQDGISGRPNYVWDVEKQTTAMGRFGLKANKPTLDMIVAGAFANDLGINNPLAPNQPCTALQASCSNIANGNDENGFELPADLLQLVVNFNRDLAPVQRRNSHDKNVLAGRELFYQVGCNQCHNPRFTTQKSSVSAHLSEQIIWPYSDFLLHDMGPDLADGRADFLASGNEWRTPPLWGVGLLSQVNGMATLLHDGRARTVEEAILWHGGEAELAKNRFIVLEKQDRERLIAFVNSL